MIVQIYTFLKCYLKLNDNWINKINVIIYDVVNVCFVDLFFVSNFHFIWFVSKTDLNRRHHGWKKIIKPYAYNNSPQKTPFSKTKSRMLGYLPAGIFTLSPSCPPVRPEQGRGPWCSGQCCLLGKSESGFELQSGLQEKKCFFPAHSERFNIVWSLHDREVMCSAWDRQGSNFESGVWKPVSSYSSHHPHAVLLAQFSLYVRKGRLKTPFFI